MCSKSSPVDTKLCIGGILGGKEKLRRLLLSLDWRYSTATDVRTKNEIRATFKVDKGGRAQEQTGNSGSVE